MRTVEPSTLPSATYSASRVRVDHTAVGHDEQTQQPAQLGGQRDGLVVGHDLDRAQDLDPQLVATRHVPTMAQARHRPVTGALRGGDRNVTPLRDDVGTGSTGDPTTRGGRPCATSSSASTDRRRRRRAAHRAAELAAAYDTNLHIVMCVDRTGVHEFAVGGDRFRADWLTHAEQYLIDVVRSLDHGRITHTIALGDPAECMCEEATRLDARSIVVGNRRVRGASRVFGSVAADVIRHAPCDVVIANTCGRDAA